MKPSLGLQKNGHLGRSGSSQNSLLDNRPHFLDHVHSTGRIKFERVHEVCRDDRRTSACEDGG